MVDIFIEGGIVLTMDKNRRIIENGAVAIEGKRIAAVGKADEIKKKYKADKVIDATGRIVMPGLICTHCHTHGQASLGMPVEIPPNFYDVLKNWWWPMIEDQLTKEDVYVISRFSCMEMIKSGITCVVDDMEAPNALPGVLESEAKAFLETGMRGILGFEATERISEENGRLGIQENLSFIKKWNKNADTRIRGMHCVHTIFTCSPEMLKRVRELADKYGGGIQLHLEESVYEVEYCKKQYGKLPVEYLSDLGFLGPDVLAAQCVHITEKEIRILAEKGVKVSHNLQTNMEIGAGIAPIPKMLDAGVTVTVGNDGFFLDMFENMRSVSLVHKGYLRDPDILPAKKVLEMTTIDGARGIGLENEIGSLEVGKKADLIVLKLMSPTPVNPENIYSQIIYLANSNNVEITIIDGEVIMENRRVLTVDEAEVREKCMETCVDLWKRNEIM